jgi:tetratricopeptide (TPR) repeat protein
MRDTPQRHRSIRAVFDHSWSLLHEDEREALKALSCFRGGFTREAAQQVAGASLQVLRGLVNKSVLLFRPGTHRYEIHELLRQYAQERLDANPRETLSAHEAHAAYYAEFMHQRWHHLRDSRQIDALGEIDVDIENIRAAWRYHVGQADAPWLKKYLNTFWLFHWIRGWNLAAVRLFKSAAETLSSYSGEVAAETVRATAMANQAFFLAWLGLAEQGYELAKRSIRILKSLNEPTALFFAYHGITLPAYYLGRFEEEKDATDHLLEIALGMGDEWLIAFAYFLAAIVSLREKDDHAAERFAAASLEGSEAVEDLIVKALAFNSLGHLAKSRGDLSRAKEYFLRSLNTAKKFGFRWAVGNATKYLGQVALLGGEIVEAERYFLQGMKIADDLGLDRDIANHLFEFARLRVAQERKEEAVEILGLLLGLPTSDQARLGSGRIRENAQKLLVKLEADLSPDTYSEKLNRGRNLELDHFLAQLLSPGIDVLGG